MQLIQKNSHHSKKPKSETNWRSEDSKEPNSTPNPIYTTTKNKREQGSNQYTKAEAYQAMALDLDRKIMYFSPRYEIDDGKIEWLRKVRTRYE